MKKVLVIVLGIVIPVLVGAIIGLLYYFIIVQSGTTVELSPTLTSTPPPSGACFHLSDYKYAATVSAKVGDGTFGYVVQSSPSGTYLYTIKNNDTLCRLIRSSDGTYTEDKTVTFANLEQSIAINPTGSTIIVAHRPDTKTLQVVAMDRNLQDTRTIAIPMTSAQQQPVSLVMDLSQSVVYVGIAESSIVAAVEVGDTTLLRMANVVIFPKVTSFGQICFQGGNTLVIQCQNDGKKALQVMSRANYIQGFIMTQLLTGAEVIAKETQWTNVDKEFGDSVVITPDGLNLFVSSNADFANQNQIGAIFIYTRTSLNNTFAFQNSVLENNVGIANNSFGRQMALYYGSYFQSVPSNMYLFTTSGLSNTTMYMFTIEFKDNGLTLIVPSDTTALGPQSMDTTTYNFANNITVAQSTYNNNVVVFAGKALNKTTSGTPEIWIFNGMCRI
jgi:hypothetical protein